MRIIPQINAEVHPVTLGTMTFGSPVKAEDALELIGFALDKGINFIDTANMYEGYNRFAGSAGGVAESIVGEALKGRRGKALIATKLGMKVGPEPEDEGTSAKAVEKHLHASLQRLQTNYVDVYYLHKPGPEEEWEETLQALENARRQGALRSYGLSNFSGAQLACFAALAKSKGAALPSLCQPSLSLLKQDALQDILPFCAREGIGVTPYQIYQGGLLTGKYQRGQQPEQGSRAQEKPEWMWQMDDSLFNRLEGFGKAAESRGMGLQQYALCWVLEQPAVVSAIAGVKNKQQLEEALQAAQGCSKGKKWTKEER